MKINFDKNKINAKNFLANAKTFIVGKSQWILVLAAFLLLGYGGYLWYSYVTNPQWDDSRRQAYVSTQESAVVFDQKKFDAIISEVEKRKVEYNNNLDNIPDIFRLK